MRIAIFDTHSFDRTAFTVANERHGFDITFFEPRLTSATARLAAGFTVICPFVNDRLDAEALTLLHAGGVRLVALRSAGYNHVDLQVAANLALPVVRVTEYSPYAVAEHAVALLLALNMKRGVMIINTGRGALIDTRALIDALKREHVGAADLDVYEEKEGVFFRNLSDQVLQDDVLARLLTFPNVLVTSHQAFLTPRSTRKYRRDDALEYPRIRTERDPRERSPGGTRAT